MMPNSFMTPVIILVAFFICGCGDRRDTDVSSLPEYQFNTFRDTRWKTKVDIAIAEVLAYTNEHRLLLLPPYAYDAKHPNYSPPVSLEKVLTVLPAGSIVRIASLMKDNGVAEIIRVTVNVESADISNYVNGKLLYIDRSMLLKNRFQHPGSSESNKWDVSSEFMEKID